MNLNATLIIEFASFIILLFVLSKLLYKPVLKLMDERQKSVKDMIENAKKAQAEAQEHAQQTHKALDMAREEALKIKEETRGISDAERRKILDEAKKEARRLIEDTKKQLGQERELILKELRSEIADISIDIAKRVLNREIKKEDHQRLVEDSIAEIENALHRP